MERMDYEWHYYIGGNCALQRRKYGGLLATITHTEQGVYEAAINRKNQAYPLAENFISVGIFNATDEAQNVIETILEDIWEK